jgi:hypothetical protein
MLALTVTALYLAPIFAGAKVGEFTGDDYLKSCTSTDPNWKPQNKAEQEAAVYCVGYIEASIAFIPTVITVHRQLTLIWKRY